MVILKFRQTSPTRFLRLFTMTWRNSSRKRWGVVAVAALVCGVVPSGSVWADEPVDPAPTAPDGDAPEDPGDTAAPETGEVEGTTVAVAAPPVPPSSDQPEIAVGAPPQPPSGDEPVVAVGLPPVPPAAEEPPVAVAAPPVPQVAAPPQVAVDAPPMPPAALFEQADAALELLGYLL